MMNSVFRNWIFAWIVVLESFGSVNQCVGVAIPQEDMQQTAVERAIQLAAPALVQIELVGGLDQVDGTRTNRGPFSGTVVTADGLIVTSSHFFEQPFAAIAIRTRDGERIAAKIIAQDRSRKFVLLKTESATKTWEPVKLSPTDKIDIGQTVVALGKSIDHENANVSIGIVSATKRIHGRAIQVDAKISAANYGGLIVDLHGQPLGIIVPLSPDEDDPAAGLDWYDSGIGFAVPIRDVLQSVEKMKSGADLHRGILGIGFSPKSTPFQLPIVDSCRPGSPAATVGVKPGDLIQEINRNPIQRIAQFQDELGGRYAGEIVELVVKRDDSSVVLLPELAAELPLFEQAALGILPSDLVEKEMRIKAIRNDSPLMAGGVKLGSTVDSINGKTLSDWSQLRAELNSFLPGQEIELGVTDVSGDSKSSRIKLIPLSAGPWPVADDATSSAEKFTINRLKLAEFSNRCSLIVPDGHSGPLSLLVWLSEPGEVDSTQFVADLQASAGAGVAVMLVQSSEPQRWQIDEIEAVVEFLALAKREIKLDLDRIAIGGQGTGAAMASLVALQSRQIFHGLVLRNGTISDRIRDVQTEPGLPLLVWSSQTVENDQTASIKADMLKLQTAKFPVHIDPASPVETPVFFPKILKWVATLNQL